MRGHGSVSIGPSVYEAVYTAIKLETNANCKPLPLHWARYMSDGEIAETPKHTGGTHRRDSRAWEYWKRRANAEALCGAGPHGNKARNGIVDALNKLLTRFCAFTSSIFGIS
jgi:hypothetical protein